MKYFFILGRNPELSIKEIMGYLERKNIRFNKFYQNRNSAIFDIEGTLNAGTVDELGGTIGIGVIISESNEIVSLLKDMDRKEIYFGEDNKMNYVIWEYSKHYNEVKEYISQRFKREKLKATRKKFGSFIEMQNGETIKDIQNRNSINEEYFVFDGDKIYFGKIVQRYNYKEIEKRDMNKPSRRSELSISPRLAKIMINLSGVKENEKLIDCFSGIGVILQEALIQDINVMGIDKNSDAIKDSKKNLEWFKFDKSKYNVLVGDSRKISMPGVSVMVSEPDLGDILKTTPKKEKAVKTLKNFEKLMIDVLNNIKKKVDKRFVFTMPYIKTHKGERIGANPDRICNETGLKLIDGYPIKEYRKNQIVGREIMVLGK